MTASAPRWATLSRAGAHGTIWRTRIGLLRVEFRDCKLGTGLNRSGFGDCGLVWELRYGSHEPLCVFVLRIE